MGEPGAGYGSGNRFDFWIPVHDRASATYSVRMSGLPVFRIGLSLALSGLVLLVDPVSPMTLGWILAALSVPLIVLGLMLRGGRASLAPMACALFLGAAAIEVWMRRHGVLSCAASSRWSRCRGCAAGGGCASIPNRAYARRGAAAQISGRRHPDAREVRLLRLRLVRAGLRRFCIGGLTGFRAGNFRV